jgi:serine/threonine protein kinase
MSALQTTPDSSQSDSIRCKRCDTLLPAYATFCRVCGERVGKDARKSPQPDAMGVSERYRIAALIRRRAYVQLFLAIDNQQQKPVVICDIDVRTLDEDKRAEAIKAMQREYDLLRRYRTPDVMPVIDLRYFQGHIFTIAGWPFATESNEQQKRYTLHDLLQSGIGLPDEQTAILWIYRLTQAVSNLHSQLIVIGDLDSHTVIVSDESYDGMPALIVGWLPLPIRGYLPQETALANSSHHFTAPEALLGNVEAASDIYSLGALLYLLLTGTAPDGPEQRERQALRTPREINPHVSARVDEVVMRALALKVEDRFEDAEEMADALLQLCATTKAVHGKASPGKASKGVPGNIVADKIASALGEGSEEPIDDPEEVTISVSPIQAQLARWYMSKIPTGNLKPLEQHGKASEVTRAEQKEAPIEDQVTQEVREAQEVPEENLEAEETLAETPTPEPLPEPIPRPVQTTGHDTGEHDKRTLRERITGVLPALRRSPASIPSAPEPVRPATGDEESTLLKRLQRFFLGEQQRQTTAAALIETPLRIQPNQGYSLRIHLIGRDTPTPLPGARKGTPAAGGLSALVQGESVHIEVRSALFQNYAYIVQRADVQIPARGYAAEVTIPMQALTNGRNGRRERLHIFFMDAERKPLYEKPFVIELFISHLVQAGREGHNVLSIPL